MSGWKKAVTFSFDDGITQDIRLIGILDRYGLKATFNLNSDLLGMPGSLIRKGISVSHQKVSPGEAAKIYRNHEVAVHTLTHPNLTTLEESEIIRQVEQDRLNLSRLCGYEVVGMAYPCGGVNHDSRVEQIIKTRTGIRYARTITSSHRFEKQPDLLAFDPTEHIVERDRVMEAAKAFLQLDGNAEAVLYIWGHGYELDVDQSWGWFEDLCRMLGGRDDVFYGTNREVLLSPGTNGCA